jgi:hypothetical protein
VHGPGIKLLNGLYKTRTSGVHDLRLPLPCASLLQLAADWTNAKVPYCYWPSPLGEGTPHEEGNTPDATLVNSFAQTAATAEHREVLACGHASQ